MKCQDCGQELTEIKGFDNSHESICSNTSCPSKFTRFKCPECGSTEKSNINSIGIGTSDFTCKNCGRKWNSLDQE